MFSSIGKIIEERIQAILQPQYRILYENVMETPEEGETSLRLTDVGGNTNLISGTKDSGVKRVIGTYIIEVFTQYGNGKRENDLIVDDIFDCFDGYEFGNFKILTIDKQTTGKDNVLNLFRQNVILTYQYDKCS